MNYYDVLGVSQDAPADDISDAYLDKIARVAPERFVDAPSEVVAAVKRASVAIEAAWHVLGDAKSRAEYDSELRVATTDGRQIRVKRLEWRRRHAEHVWRLEERLGLPLTPVLGLEPPDGQDLGATTDRRGSEVAQAAPDYSWNDPLATFANWLAPHARKERHVSVPDVCGLHASDALYEIAKADLHIRFVRLTEHPVGDGVVVDQDPAAGSMVRRGSTVTVQAVYEVGPPSLVS